MPYLTGYYCAPRRWTRLASKVLASPTRFELVPTPWKGVVLTISLWGHLVYLIGIEPMISCLKGRCLTSWLQVHAIEQFYNILRLLTSYYAKLVGLGLLTRRLHLLPYRFTAIQYNHSYLWDVSLRSFYGFKVSQPHITLCHLFRWHRMLDSNQRHIV